MKFFLFFASQNVLCEQTPQHITKPCVIFEQAPELDDIQRVAALDFEYPGMTQCRVWTADTDAGVYKIQCSNPRDPSFREYAKLLEQQLNQQTKTKE